MELDLEKPVAESLASAVYRQLKRKLMVGQLKPGDTLTLRALSDSLEISQTPVREALLRLVSERLLHLRHGRSVRVPMLDGETFVELRQIRVHLETFATQKAVTRIGPGDVAILERIHREYMKCRARRDTPGVLAANIDFHFTLYRPSGMPNLLAMIENLWAQTGPYAGFLYESPATEHPDGHPHEHILTALRAGRARDVADKVRLDVLRHGDRMIQSLRAMNLLPNGHSPALAPQRPAVGGSESRRAPRRRAGPSLVPGDTSAERAGARKA